MNIFSHTLRFFTPLALFASVLLSAFAFGADIPDPNVIPRVVGTDVGVQGGIPTTRTNIINVTSAPYYASGNNTDTTGTITSGTDSLVVASAAGWTTGMGINVGRKAVLTMTVTGSASAGNFIVKLPMNDPAVEGQTYYREYTFAMSGGESTTTIASTVRAYTDFLGWTVAGSGSDCVFTAKTVNVRPVGENYGSANVTTSWAVTTAGFRCFTGTVTNISGTTFTLSGNATASVTDGTVSHRDDLAIQAAIAASSAEDIIYMPAGTYILNTKLVLSDYSNRTLRGAGLSSTILDVRYDTLGVELSKSGDYAWASQVYARPAQSADNTVSVPITQGDTTITIGSTSAFTVGQSIQLAIDNQYDNTEIAAGEVMTYSMFGFNTLRRPMHRIVSKTSTTLTITPAAYFTPASNLGVYVNYQLDSVVRIGLEGFTVSGANGPLVGGIKMEQAQNCWMKGVQVTKASNYPVQLYDSIFLEVRESIFQGVGRAGTNGAGLLMNHVCASLIENNQGFNAQPIVEVNYSSVGNIIGYNFFNSSSFMNLDLNHGPHNSHNLVEGNITAGIIVDTYFGSSSNDTIYRNWTSGADYETGTYLGTIAVNRWAYYYGVIGNIYGAPSNPYTVSPYDPWDFGYPFGGITYGGNVNPYANDFWPQWNNIVELTTRTSDTAGVLTITSGSGVIDFNGMLISIQPLSAPYTSYSMTASSQTGSAITFTGYPGVLPSVGATYRLYFGTGNEGMKEIDDGTKATWASPSPGTATVIGNYNANSTVQAIPADQALGANTLSDSYYTTKAAMEARGVVWGNLTFPPFDPTNAGTLTQAGWERIPAGYRYMNGGNDPPSGAGTQATVTGTTTVTGTLALP